MSIISNYSFLNIFVNKSNENLIDFDDNKNYNDFINFNYYKPKKTTPIPIPLPLKDINTTIKKLSLLILYDNNILVGIAKDKLILPNSEIYSCNFNKEIIRIMNEDLGIKETFEYNIIYKYKSNSHYYINFKSKPFINGPIESKQKNYEQSNQLIKDFESELILNYNGYNSGLCWVPIKEIINSNNKYVVESSYVKVISYYYHQFII